jgi:hypothetical protein
LCTESKNSAIFRSDATTIPFFVLERRWPRRAASSDMRAQIQLPPQVPLISTRTSPAVRSGSQSASPRP